MKGRSSHLFPHSNGPEDRLKMMCFLFGRITLFQPWFMEKPAFLSDIEALDIIRVFHPPASLKPETTFKAILAEYRNWISVNQGKNLSSFLNIRQGDGPMGRHTWEIRGMIRDMGKDPEASLSVSSLKWHLLLHLAREMEDSRWEAERALEALREKKSPLRGSIETDEELKDLFGDLPHFDSEPVIHRKQRERIIEAWFGLFGDYLSPRGLLLTFEKDVYDLVSDLCDETELSRDAPGRSFAFQCPDLSNEPWDKVLHMGQVAPCGDHLKTLRDLLLRLGSGPDDTLLRLEGLIPELEKAFPKDPQKGSHRVTIRPLPEFSSKGAVLEGLSGKTIILVD